MSDSRLERIEQKLDDTNEHLASIDATLAAQHESLKAHMRRTELLESEMKPVKEHVAMIQGVLKLIGLITGLGAAYEFLKKLI